MFLKFQFDFSKEKINLDILLTNFFFLNILGILSFWRYYTLKNLSEDTTPLKIWSYVLYSIFIVLTDKILWLEYLLLKELYFCFHYFRLFCLILGNGIHWQFPDKQILSKICKYSLIWLLKGVTVWVKCTEFEFSYAS